MPGQSLPCDENRQNETAAPMLAALEINNDLFEKDKAPKQVARIASHPYPSHLKEILLLVKKCNLFERENSDVRPQENFIKILNHPDTLRLLEVIQIAQDVRIFNYTFTGQQFLSIILDHKNLSDLLSLLQVALRVGLFDQGSFLQMPANYLPRANFGLIVQHPNISTFYSSMLLLERVESLLHLEFKEKSRMLRTISEDAKPIQTTEQTTPVFDQNPVEQGSLTLN